MGVPGSERNILCFPGTFFTRADLQSLRLYHFTDGWHPFVVAAEVFYLLFLFYYMVVQVRDGLVAPWSRDGDGGMPVPSLPFPSSLGWGLKEGEGKALLICLPWQLYGVPSTGPED